ncbi:MAG: CoA transferase, partial [Chloroflexota bacterium]|nr:CoA transferase [Chloroflexota bacterium]
LFWLAYNAGKKGITLDLESARGAEIFRALVKGSHFLVESFPPGHLDRLGLGYPSLSKLNPGLIMASVTPFGQEGPYSGYKGSDLTAMAMGGMAYLIGDPEGAPLRISVPQAYFHGSAHACVAMMIAHFFRERTGKGQYLDVSTHECVTRLRYWELRWWEYEKVVTRRGGSSSRSFTPFPQRQVWPCKDGYVGFRVAGGATGRGLTPLVKWMDEEGMAGPLKEIKDWSQVDIASITPEENRRREEVFGRFLLTHTKEELRREAVKRRFHLMPVNSSQDVAHDRQLKARGFWHEVAYPELGVSLTHPGSPFRFNGRPLGPSRRAPLMGEHNGEIYGELGLTEHDLDALKGQGVV